MNKFLSRLGSIALLCVAACGGGGGGGGGSSVTAPSNLEYPRPVGVLTVDVASAPNTPTYDGSPATFAIDPALPDGIQMNPQTGAISGIPSQASLRTTYTVTASNAGGSTTALVKLSVVLPTRFAYLMNQADSTITVCTVDAETGRLHNIGYRTAPASQVGPERMAVHPSGRFAYVSNLNSDNLSVYTINTQEGWLAAGNAVSLGAGPHYPTIDPSGRFIYVTSQNSDQIHVFSIHQNNGSLTLVQLLPTGVQPSACATDPDGKFLFVALRGNPVNGAGSAIQAYDINAVNGTIAANVPSLSVNGTQPTDISMDPAHPRFVVSLERFDFVIPITFDTLTGALTLGVAEDTGDRPVAVAVEPTGRFAYVANRNDGTVSWFTIDQATGDLTPVNSISAGLGTNSILSDPAGRFLYVLNTGSRILSQFQVLDDTGGLVLLESTVTRAAPNHVAFAQGAHPIVRVPRFLHVAAASSDEIPTYTIDVPSGSLNEVPNPPMTQDRPVSVATDPKNRFLFVAHETARSIGAYTINSANGALAAVGAPALTSGRPSHLTVDPSGRFLYASTRDVVNPNDGWVTTWIINQNDGSLAQGDTHQVGNQALWVECDPTGGYLYVACKGSGPGTAVISKLRISSTNGALTDLGTPEVASGVTALGFHPSKPALYAVLNTANAIATYTMDPVSGDLTIVPGGAGNSGIGPTSIEITPDGKFGFVTYFDAPGNGHVSRFAVDPVTAKLIVPAVQYQDGMHPTDLEIDGTGRTLYVTNSGSNDISVFQVDPATGVLTLSAPAMTGLEPSAVVVTTITQ
ncbi:MAG: lactonase family protein [Planctomycetota bacterium]